MLPRLTASLLSVVLGLAGVLTSPMACKALCSLTATERAECCRRGAFGLSAPPCCEGPQRLGGKATPATVERGGPDVRMPLVFMALALPAAAGLLRALPSAPLPAGIGPPGRGPLIAQHTSLLL